MLQANQDGQKNSGTGSEAGNQEFKALRDECEQLRREYKRHERELKLFQMRLERIRKMSEATVILNRVAAVKHSELEHFINLIMQNSPNFILMFDAENRLSYCTDSFLRGCGIPTVGSIRGLHYRELFELYTEHEFVEMMDSVIASFHGSNNVVEFTEMLDFGHSGVLTICSVQVAPMVGENVEQAGFMVFFHDVTELMDAKRKADYANEAKSSFLARMSHEMRTPLNTIIGMSELISRKDIPRGMAEYVSTIQQAGHNLLVIINDVLDFSKIEAGQMRVVPERYYFASMIHDVVNLTQVRLLGKPLDFVVRVDSDIPEQLLGDEVRTKQILLNLLSNAVKYTYSGHISLDVRFEDAGNGDIRFVFVVGDSGVGIRQTDLDRLFGDFVRIENTSMREVEGTGLGLAITRSLCRAMGGDVSVKSEYGIGSTFTATIIQTPLAESDKKLASVENAAARKVLVLEERPVCLDSLSYALTNLGVSMESAENLSDFAVKLAGGGYDYAFVPSKYIADSMLYIGKSPSRTVLVNMVEMDDVSSYKDVNSVTMPLFCINVANALNGVTDGDVSALRKHRLSFRIPEAKVLIVDDISTNLRVSKELLSLYGLEAHTCLSGQEAINLARANRYDIIFMDHMMPGMDGIEAASIIRATDPDDGYYRGLPIIALTANAVSGQREMFLRSGMSDFLAKPIDLQKLDSILQKWLPKEMLLDLRNDAPDESAAMGHVRLFEIPGVSVETGLANSGGSVEAYLDILDVFCTDIEEKSKQIEQCAANGDLSLYMTLAHAFKGASRSIGAAEFGDLAAQMEGAARAGDMDTIALETGAFLAFARELTGSIRNSMKLNGARGRQNGEDLTQSRIEPLRSALECMDISAANRLIVEYSALPLNERARKTLSDIENHVLMFDYDKAVEIMDSIYSGQGRGGV
ncbi:MAG: response regulator [Synergistaceae bacterium]|jgi:signal transduction histidine kinase/CheY-like chemotaxis protein/HPt (histidine-containing phosphotransfer) domain-containing protein|nr:response regulator [Synergistaceae bacterium]